MVPRGDPWLTKKLFCQIFELFICNLVHFDTSISKIILILRTFWPKLNKWRKTILAGNSTFNSGNFEKFFWDERIFLKICMHEGQLAPSRAFDSCNKIHIDFGGFVISLKAPKCRNVRPAAEGLATSRKQLWTFVQLSHTLSQGIRLCKRAWESRLQLAR